MRVSRTILILISLASSTLLYVFTYQPYGLYPKILAIASSLLLFYILFKVILNKTTKEVYLFPFLLLNWLFFQSPFLLQEKTEYFMRVIEDKYIDEIASYACLSVVMIFIGYMFFLNKSLRPISSVKFRFHESELKNLILLFVFVGILYRIGENITPVLIAQLSNIIQILFFAPTIVFALYTLFLIRRKGQFQIDIFHFFVIGYLLIEFLLRLSTTLMAQVAILFVGALLAYYHERKKIPVSWILIIAVIFIPLYQARKYFRDTISENNISGSKLAIGTEIFENAFFEEQISKEVQDFKSKQFNKKHNRFENLSFIAHVVFLHKNGNKEFLYGETFYWLPLVPIPRIIFPSKPVNEMSTKLATEYGVRGRVSTASINFPMLIEGYVNFGFDGMVFMAFIFGLSYKWFVMKFGAGVGDLNLLMIINSVKHFIHAEGNITLVFGALIQIYLFWWVLVKVFNVGGARAYK
jgi:hypothetical protein